MNRRHNNSERGQSIILIALLIIGLMAMVALAIDGGNALNERRVTQNAADASSLGGLWYIIKTEGPTEPVMMSRIHKVIEDHGIPDSDGNLANEVNDNVTIHYTDHEGNLLFGCDTAPCGAIPENARGLSVDVRESFPTFIAGVIGIEEASVSASAIAVVVAAQDDFFSSGMALFAYGEDCREDQDPAIMSGQDNEVLGATHSNSHISLPGANHFHGQVSYVGNDTQIDVSNEFTPTLPTQGLTLTLPALLRPMGVDDFDYFADGEYVKHLTPGVDYFDVSGNEYGDPINEDELSAARAGNPVLFEDDTFRPGVYFAGDKEFHTDHGETYGNVTFVTHGRIFIGGSATVYKNFHRSGILFYTDYQPEPIDKRCEEFAIEVSGSSNGPETYVGEDYDWHEGDACPGPAPDDPCWSPGNKIYEGLIYAPRGKVFSASGENVTYIGGIIGYSLKLGGSNNIYLSNPDLFPPTIPTVVLYE